MRVIAETYDLNQGFWVPFNIRDGLRFDLRWSQDELTTKPSCEAAFASCGLSLTPPGANQPSDGEKWNGDRCCAVGVIDG